MRHGDLYGRRICPVQRSPTRLPHDKMVRQADMHGIGLLVFDLIDNDGRSCNPKFEDRLMHSSQWRTRGGGGRKVIEAHDSNIVRDGEAGIVDGLQRAVSGWIVGCKDGGGTDTQIEQPRHAGVAAPLHVITMSPINSGCTASPASRRACSNPAWRSVQVTMCLGPAIIPMRR